MINFFLSIEELKDNNQYQCNHCNQLTDAVKVNFIILLFLYNLFIRIFPLLKNLNI